MLLFAIPGSFCRSRRGAFFSRIDLVLSQCIHLQLHYCFRVRNDQSNNSQMSEPEARMFVSLSVTLTVISSCRLLSPTTCPIYISPRENEEPAAILKLVYGIRCCYPRFHSYKRTIGFCSISPSMAVGVKRCAITASLLWL